jgi:hypothetical protein
MRYRPNDARASSRSRSTMAIPDIARLLCDRLDNADPALRRLDRYYRGRHELSFASDKYRSAFGRTLRALVSNWMGLVVDACEERLTVTGFRFDSDEADADAWAIWQANALDRDSHLVQTDALVFGRAAVLVWAGADGQPRITPESPLQTAVAYAPGDRRARVAAIKRWVEDDGTAFLNLFLPDEVRRFVATSKIPPAEQGQLAAPVEWEARDTIANPLGVVPLVEFANNPRTLGDPMSEIEGVLPLQDAANKLLADTLVAAEFSAFKQRWATGMEIPTDPESNQPVEPFDAAVTRLWLAEDAQTRFGEFAATELGNYTGAIDTIVQHIASISKTPAHYLSPSADRLSGESIRAAESGLVAKVRRKQIVFGEAWEETIRLAFAVLDDARANAASAETIWSDPETRTESEHVDALTKLQTLGVPWATLMELADFSPQQIARMREEIRADALDLALFDTGGSGNAGAA